MPWVGTRGSAPHPAQVLVGAGSLAARSDTTGIVSAGRTASEHPGAAVMRLASDGAGAPLREAPSHLALLGKGGVDSDDGRAAAPGPAGSPPPEFSSEACAILVETIQGEGGIRPLTQEFFAEARALASSTGALLIVDEIQSGMGRTGKWCAYEHYGIMPDITTLAKPLAGGLPLGAVLCTEEVARVMHPGMHGTTFGGGPLACAVGIAVIDAIEKNGLLAHATKVGDYFQNRLRELAGRHEAIVDVRGKGLMIAAELDSAELAKLTVAEMMKRHIVINCTSDTVLRFLPPYILERAHVDTAIAALDEIFTVNAAAHHTTAGGHHHG